MPYITPAQKLAIANGSAPESAGELNYAITKLVDAYAQPPRTYQAINDVLGALEGAKLEFYRRVAVPYENTKLSTNGDVYGS